MMSFHNNPALKQSILLQLEDQLGNCKLQPLIIDRNSIEIYAAPGRPPINYPACSDLLGLPESLLKLMMLEADWCSYTDMKEAVRDTVKERLEFFQAVPVGKDLTYLAHCYLQWLMTETSFGAARFANELGKLLPATLRCLESNIANDELLEKISLFKDQAKEKYSSLHDDDIQASCRWSRVGQIAEFLQNIHYYLTDNACISQDEISHLLCMGLGLADDQNYFEVVKKMDAKLFLLLKSFG